MVKKANTPEQGHPGQEKPAVDVDEAAAGGSWEYTDKAKNKPLLHSLRDNWFALFRTRKPEDGDPRRRR